MGSVVRNAEEKNQKERKTNLLVLVRDYLVGEGYLDTLRIFESETKLSKEWQLCDNVDLNSVVEEYEAYYFVRFKKYPKISRRNNANCIVESKNKEKKKIVTKVKVERIEDCGEKPLELECLKVEPVISRSDSSNSGGVSFKLWKGLGTYEGYSDEWKSYADVIAREVIDRNLNVKWEDVIGLENAKQHLREAIVYPIKYPEIFKGILTPWKGLLLYGPSGTGKTLLAKAVATECSTTFFNISASSLVSKWRGDSEKLVRVMFELARHQAPSTIFIDELDALASKRDRPSEHEASRRLKSEFFVQLDGLLESSKNIFLLTTSNLPWDLDPAILRRLEKKIFVDSPDETGRTALFGKFLPPVVNRYIKTDIDRLILARNTVGFTGADLKLVCKEALMEATRNVITGLEKSDRYGNVGGKIVTTEDVLNILQRIKPVNVNTNKFVAWPEMICE